MARVTSKYQVTVPRVIADQYGIRPGDDIDWVPAGEVIRVIPAAKLEPAQDVDTRVRWFDLATERQRKRQSRIGAREVGDRGWRREDLYGRGRSH